VLVRIDVINETLAGGARAISASDARRRLIEYVDIETSKSGLNQSVANINMKNALMQDKPLLTFYREWNASPQPGSPNSLIRAWLLFKVTGKLSE
jgi:hypothetical protein